MARNLMWILQREGPDGRVLVFAANNHVRKSTRLGLVELSKGNTAQVIVRESDLDQYLDDLIGKRMIVIGSFFNQGAVGEKGGETRQIPPSPPLSLNTGSCPVRSRASLASRTTKSSRLKRYPL